MVKTFFPNFHDLFFVCFVCFSIFTTYHIRMYGTTVSNLWVKSVIYLLIFHVNLILDTFVVTRII